MTVLSTHVRIVSLDYVEAPNAYRTARGVWVTGTSVLATYEAPDRANAAAPKCRAFTNERPMEVESWRDEAYTPGSNRCIKKRLAVLNVINLRKCGWVKESSVAPEPKAVPQGQKRSAKQPRRNRRGGRNRHAA